MKKAEDSERSRRPLEGTHGQPGAGTVLHFAAAITAAREIDAQERPIGNATVQTAILPVDLKAFGLRAFAIKLAPPAAPCRADDERVGSACLRYRRRQLPRETRRRRDGRRRRQPIRRSCCRTTHAARGRFPTRPAPTARKTPCPRMARSSICRPGISTACICSSPRMATLPVRSRSATSTSPSTCPTGPALSDNGTTACGTPRQRAWITSATTIGLTPGFIKRTPVAWFATHHNTPQGDAFYDYSYLFQLSYDLPAGTTSADPAE